MSPRAVLAAFTVLVVAIGATACATPLQAARPASAESPSLEAQIFKLQKDSAKILSMLEEMRSARATGADPATACAESAVRLVEVERQLQILEEQLLATQRKLDETLFEVRALRRSPGSTLGRDTLAQEVPPLPAPGPADQAGTGDPSRPPADAGAPPPVTGTEPRDLFNAAYTDFSRSSYDVALKGFTAALAADPSGPLAATSQYYVGETLLALERHADAVAAFERVITGYPESDRVLTARLRRGLALFELRRTVESVQALQEIIDQHPQSDEARIAREFFRRKGIVQD